MRQFLAEAGLDVNQLNMVSATQMQGPGGLNLASLQQAFRGEFILSLEDLEFPKDSPIPTFRVLSGLSVAGAEHEVQQLLDFLVMAISNNPKIKVEQGSLD